MDRNSFSVVGGPPLFSKGGLPPGLDGFPSQVQGHLFRTPTLESQVCFLFFTVKLLFTFAQRVDWLSFAIRHLKMINKTTRHG